MSNSVKTKFAGVLRGLLRRLDDNEAATPQTPRVLTSTALPTGATPVAAAFPHTAPAASKMPSAIPASAVPVSATPVS